MTMTQTLERPVIDEASTLDPFLAIVQGEKFVITVTPETLILAMRAVVTEQGEHRRGLLHVPTHIDGLAAHALILLGVKRDDLVAYEDFLIEGDAGMVPDGIFHLANGSAIIADLADERDQDGWCWAEIVDAAEQTWADAAHTRY